MVKRTSRIILSAMSIALFLLLLSCNKKDKVDTDPALTLNFSTDTIFFDTIFTTIGSVTKRLLVYNNNDNKINITSIQLAGGPNSFYKMNIDGVSAHSASNIEIPGHDSLFIFIRITIDPKNVNTPFIVSDSIVFNTNGNTQDVQLVSWGQDAEFYKDKTFTGSNVWDSLKPHVIYGYVRVDTGADLSITEGARVYFHKGAYLAVSSQATLKIAGTLNHPVRFQGDRLDPFYRDLPGQWDGIYLEKGSARNEINYAIIKNGSFGVFIDTINSPNFPALKIDNTIIQNMTGTGLSAYASSIVSTNCVIGNCGSAALEIVYGGSYDFRQLTIGNYWSASARISPSVYISDFTYDQNFTMVINPLVKAYFGNCIIYGSEDDEIRLDSAGTNPFNFTFDHVLLKTEADISSGSRYIECLRNEDPVFVDVTNYNFAIDSISPAIKKGIPVGVLFDINGVERGQTPDLGAYQYIKR